MRRLIVNADDLGMHLGMNAGIFQAHREGIVTSVSLSPVGTAFDDAVAGLRDHPELGVGLHLTLVGETALCPASELPTLAPTGQLPRYFTVLFRRLLLGTLDAAEIERELAAQIERARDAGVEVSHLDSHQHVHLHPSILPVVLRLGERFGIRRIRAGQRLIPLFGVRAGLLAPFARRGARKARARGFATPDHLAGVSVSGRLDEPHLDTLVRRLPRGVTELVCHPGLDDAAIGSAYPWDFRWAAETTALTSARIRESLRSAAIELVTYRDL